MLSPEEWGDLEIKLLNNLSCQYLQVQWKNLKKYGSG